MITDAKDFLGKKVEVVVDRSLGSKHPKHGFVYEANYGYIPNTISPDGEELDAYYLGVSKPLKKAKGVCIAIIHRTNDDDDKLVVIPEGLELTDEEIKERTEFQEKWFKHVIIKDGHINRQTILILEKFKELVHEIDNRFFYCVMGGIAVDGYMGRLTRNHPDVDMLVFREDLERTENVLRKLGYDAKRFTHPEDSSFVYKMQTGDEDHIFSFQIIDLTDEDKFEISFWRNSHIVFPLSLIKPVNWLELDGMKYPAVSKKLLIKLKENEDGFFRELKKSDNTKYMEKRRLKHLNIIHDLKLLKK